MSDHSTEQYRIKQEPYYRTLTDEVALYEAAYATRMPVMLKGPTGCGKSRFVEYMAWKLGRPLITVACNEDMTASDLVGRYLLDANGPRRQAGADRAPRAQSQGPWPRREHLDAPLGIRGQSHCQRRRSEIGLPHDLGAPDHRRRRHARHLGRGGRHVFLDVGWVVAQRNHRSAPSRAS